MSDAQNAEYVREMLDRFGPGDDVPWVYVQALLDVAYGNPVARYELEEGVGGDVIDKRCVVGFTGTREGMTSEQAGTVGALLTTLGVIEAHHGDCVGSDETLDRICRIQKVPIVVHPPDDPKLRAFCETSVEYPERPYLARNRDIVDLSDTLIATPKETMEASKGGTWYTVRYARQQNRRVIIVWPDGSTHIDGSGAADDE